MPYARRVFVKPGLTALPAAFPGSLSAQEAATGKPDSGFRRAEANIIAPYQSTMI
jgi:hypothetical protein